MPWAVDSQLYKIAWNGTDLLGRTFDELPSRGDCCKTSRWKTACSDHLRLTQRLYPWKILTNNKTWKVSQKGSRPFYIIRYSSVFPRFELQFIQKILTFHFRQNTFSALVHYKSEYETYTSTSEVFVCSCASFLMNFGLSVATSVIESGKRTQQVDAETMALTSALFFLGLTKIVISQ